MSHFKGKQFQQDVIIVAVGYYLYLPGCLTVTEIKESLKAGVDIVKLFPGSAYGPAIISAFKAPLPQINMVLLQSFKSTIR